MITLTVHESAQSAVHKPAIPLGVADDEAFGPLVSVMQEVSEAFEADGMVVAWHDGAHDPTLLFASGTCGTPRAAERELARTAPLAAAARSGATQSSWMIGAEDSSSTHTTAIPIDGATVTLTTAFRNLGAATRGRVRKVAEQMVPMMQGFFRLWSLRAAAVARIKGLTAAINSCDAAVLLVDNEGRLAFANEAAERLLAQGDGLRRTGGTLGGHRLADTLRLQAAIEHVITGADPRSSAPVVALHRRGGRPLMAAIVAADDAPAKHGGAVVYVFDPAQNLHPLIEPVCKLYGLSPVETRLTCLLADGMSLVDAAERMHVREQTARSYLKQIFMKTDTNRQAELVWLMLKSSVRTAPGCTPTFI